MRSPEQLTELAEAYRLGASLSRLAMLFGFRSPSTVAYHLRQLGVPIRSRGAKITRGTKRHMQARLNKQVRRAVAKGIISGPPDACEWCKAPARTIINDRVNPNAPQTRFSLDAHHPDYSKPLEVVWICAKCHRQFHSKIEDNEKTVSVDPPPRGVTEGSRVCHTVVT